MKRSPRRLAFLAPLAPAVFLIAAACGGSGGGAQASDTQTGAVQRGNLLVAVSTTGSVSLPKQAKLTFPASGTVTDVQVEWGQDVKEGQVLARMDDTTLKASLLDAQMSLLKAQKAVTDYLDEFSPDQVTKARNAVSTANTTTLQAQKATSDYQDQFSADVVTKARNAVSTASTTVLQAQKALSDYQDQFSADVVTKARNAVSTANTTALQAQKALDNYLETFTALGVIKAQSAVVSAQVVEAQAEKALKDYQDTFSQDNRNKLQTARNNASLAVQNAQDALAKAKQQTAGNPVYDAQVRRDAAELEVRNAQVSLDAANNDLSVANIDWSLRVILSERQVTVAETAYRDRMQAAYRISLNQPDLLQRPPAFYLPVDTIVATSVQDAWNTLSDQRTSLSILLLQKEKAHAAVQNTVAKTDDALKAARRSRDEAAQALQTATVAEPARLRGKELDIERAEIALVDAQTELNKALLGPDPVQISVLRASIEAAKVRRLDALKALDDARSGPDQKEMAILAAGVEGARARVQEAQTSLSTLLAGPDQKQLAILAAGVDGAKARVQEAQTSLSTLLAGPDQKQWVILAAGVDGAKARVQEAETALATVLAGPDPVERASRDTAVASAQLRLQQAKDNLDRAILKAPFSGAVSAVGVAVGDTVGSNTVAVTLVDNRTLEVTVSVDEIDLPKIKVGQPAALTSDASTSLRVGGVVKAIAPVARVQQGVASYDVLLTLQAPGNQGTGSQALGNLGAGGQRAGGQRAGGQSAGNQAIGSASLRGGMTLNVQIVVESKQDVLLVPLRAVQTSGGNRVVNVLENGVATAKKVTIGSSNQQFAEVVDGLNEGDKVVIPARATTTQQQQFRLPGGIVPGGGGIVPAGGARPPAR